MKRSLPKSIAAGAARQERRAQGLAPKRTTLESIKRQVVPVRPVLPAPAAGGASPLVAQSAPIHSPGRLTAIRAIQAQRDKARASQVQASPLEARRAVASEVRSSKIARKAAGTRLTRKNPASPMADLNRGVLRYTGAFSSSPQRAPFQKSWNIRRSFGA